MIARRRALAVLVGAGLLCASTANAQSVQRCESAEGKVTYSNTSCPAGTEPVRKLEPDEGPSAADQKAARERAQQHSRELDKLERQRQKEEDNAARDRATAEVKQAKHET